MTTFIILSLTLYLIFFNKTKFGPEEITLIKTRSENFFRYCYAAFGEPVAVEICLVS